MTLSEEILRIARPYLGLATNDLVLRVSRTLVGVELARVEHQQVHSLAYWVGIAAGRLMATERAQELARRIRELGGSER